jgi:peptidoglycan/LPS O-acetylase OafA/YrhL
MAAIFVPILVVLGLVVVAVALAWLVVVMLEWRRRRRRRGSAAAGPVPRRQLAPRDPSQQSELSTLARLRAILTR